MLKEIPQATAGVLLALAAYAVYSCGDAIIKGFGSNLTPFEIGFFITLFSLLPAIFTKPRGEHWRHLGRLQHPWRIHLRSLTGVCASLCVIYSFTRIPLAETYSIVFLTPIFVVILSVVFLKESVLPARWILLAASFVGVLLVVRPGFRELQLGHVTALACAMFGSVTTTVLKQVAARETRVSLLGVAAAYSLVINGAAMAPNFHMPSIQQMALLATIGGLAGSGHILFIAATRRADASLVAPMQYSQILWAIVLGAVFYREFPDLVAIAGLAIILVAGVLNVISDKTRIRVVARFATGRAKPGDIRPTPVIEAESTTEV